MVIDVYKNGLGVPGKCGSRYFWRAKGIIGLGERRLMNDLINEGIKLNYIIVRNPLSHLESALQTELMECFDNEEKILKILKSFLDTEWGGSHYHPQFCQKIYKHFWNDGKLEVIDLEDSTMFLKKLLNGITIKFDKTDYDFHDDNRYITKQQSWDRCMELYPDLMDRLIKYTEEDTKWYNMLLGINNNLI